MKIKRLAAAIAFFGNGLVVGILLTGGRVSALGPIPRRPHAVHVDLSVRPPHLPLPDAPSLLQDRLGALLDGIDQCDLDRRYERWLEIDRLYQCDPAIRNRMVRIATGEIPMGHYQRFVVTANVAGLGFPSTCGPLAPKNMPLGVYLPWLQLSPARHRPTYRIAWDPRLSMLPVDLNGDPHKRRTVQEFLWDIITTYRLDFRSLPDSTLYFVSTVPDV
jgi:hypothetical protein